MAKPTQQLKHTALRRSLCFYSPPPDGSDPEYIEGTSEVPGRRNYLHQKESVLITDIRGHEKSFTLDEHSFTAPPRAFNLSIDFTEPTEMTRIYLPWVNDLILQHKRYCIQLHPAESFCDEDPMPSGPQDTHRPILKRGIPAGMAAPAGRGYRRHREWGGAFSNHQCLETYFPTRKRLSDYSRRVPISSGC